MSRARGVVAAAIAVAVVLAGPVRASAPPDQYETFERVDRCIVDHFTRLTWQRAPLASTAAWTPASTACASALGAGWRLPSMKELETLVDEVPHFEDEGGTLVTKAIDANAFPRTPVGSSYWTLSGVAGDPSRAWTIQFTDGSTSSTPRIEAHAVRCVIPTGASLPAACQ